MRVLNENPPSLDKPMAGIRKKYWTAGMVPDKNASFPIRRPKNVRNQKRQIIECVRSEKGDRLIFRSHRREK
jgi:hypothetical protein